MNKFWCKNSVRLLINDRKHVENMWVEVAYNTLLFVDRNSVKDIEREKESG